MIRKFIYFIFSIFLLSSIRVYSNESEFVFRHLTLESGLSNSNVNCIIQDNNGFIWIGTENGLNKFDGYKFTHYFSDIYKDKSLFSNEILSLMVDSKGALWVGTFQGLFKYNEHFDNFDHIAFEDISQLNTNIPVYSLLEDSDSIIWIGTSGGGLFKYHITKGTLKNYQQSENDGFSLSSNFIFSLYKDLDNVMWIGTTDNGLDKFDRLTEKFYNFKPIEGVENQQNVNAILEIFEYKKGQFLLGTRGDGLFLFDTENKEFSTFEIQMQNSEIARPTEIYNIYRDSQQRLWISTHGNGLFYINESNKAIRLEHSAESNSSLINNNIRTLFEDAQGNLWIVSYQGGINFLPNAYKKFQTYFLDSHNDYATNIATSVVCNEKGNLWVGTDGGGLKYIDRVNNSTTHFYPERNGTGFVPDKVVMSLLLDGDNLWIGTYLKGISVYNTKTKKVNRFVNADTPKSLSSNFISCFLKKTDGSIWVGTNGGGINKFDPETNSFINFKQDESALDKSLVNNYVNVITEDNNGRLWIGTFWGLSVFDPLNGMFIKYQQNELTGLSNNTIYSIKITSKNEVWLGTRNGLNKFIPSSNTFQSFSLADGLSGNVIYAIEEDNTGNLWLSTNNGICNFNPNTYETRNYYKSDGFLSNEFFRNASYLNNNGEMFFGSLNGLVSFFPDSINENYEIPKATVTRFSIFNQEIIPGAKLGNDKILKKPIYLTDTIILKYKYNSFAFEFSALDYILPEKNNYKCMMEGFDQDWRLLKPDQRYVTYTNLDAGAYIFKVKASSIDNEWNEQTTNITLIVKPPIYRTWWAYSLYYIILMGVVLFFWRLSIKRVKLVNEIKFERFERDKANEINQAKLRFFTNISHEFRTPITLILGPIERMLDDKFIQKKYSNSLHLMMKNANRLLRMVNQLMDLRKIETGQMKLKTEQADIILFLKDIYTSFVEFAEQKKIEFRFLSEMESEICWFDADKIDKIVFNLLSNAFKFTAENGEIAVVVEKIQNIDTTYSLKISVIDTGRGIAEKDLNKIFDRFFQSTDESQRYSMGSGVGLSLTKSLVEQHYGEIKVTSVEKKGTEFVVILPLNENIYTDEEKFSPKVPGVNKYIHITPEDVLEEEFDVKIVGDKNQTVLIVEDNYDLRRYIVNEFATYYNILEADNGKVALNMALQEMPDIIISDVVMPEMDGLELCGKIKENFLTNHIPVILLTARASIEHRIIGINQGADSYIPKPFNPGHLKIRVKKLLELRQILKQKYANDLASPDLTVLEEDIYLREIKEMILKNIDDSELNIEKICKEMGISRAHFYRKVKLITDKSPTEFVRIIRLNEAAKLLIQARKSVSEVCYMVGFNSPSYFSICFKEHFKVSPIDFVKNNQKQR